MRRVQTVLLCEGLQHEVFVRRFLKRRGLRELVNPRDLRVLKSPGGAADQFVRQRYPIELAALRRRSANTLLIVVIDGDGEGVQGRRESLANECLERGIEDRTATESVVVIVPTWNIETWLAYLAGESVDETKRDYPRLPKESDCQPLVDALAAMCQQGELRPPAPASLQNACEEYERFRAMPQP